MVKLSVITVNLNNRNGLYKTIESVLGQKAADSIEYIVIDGLSSDGSDELIRSYGGRIQRAVIEKDSGIYNAMNKGIRLAQGDYLLFLNSADVLKSEDTISRILPYLDGTDLIIGLTEYGNKETGHFELTKLPPHGCDLNYLIRASLPHQSTFIRRELLADGYDESLKICSDWKFFLKAYCLEKCTIKTTDEVVAVFDMSGISTDARNYAAIHAEKKKVLWEELRFDLDDWKATESRSLTADYYEKLWVMKWYFRFNAIIRRFGLKSN